LAQTVSVEPALHRRLGQALLDKDPEQLPGAAATYTQERKAQPTLHSVGNASARFFQAPAVPPHLTPSDAVSAASDLNSTNCAMCGYLGNRAHRTYVNVIGDLRRPGSQHQLLKPYAGAMYAEQIPESRRVALKAREAHPDVIALHFGKRQVKLSCESIQYMGLGDFRSR